MDPHGVNPLGLQGMSVPMVGGLSSMPMSMSMPMAASATPQQMAALGMGVGGMQPYGLPPQQAQAQAQAQQQAQAQAQAQQQMMMGMNPMNMAAMGLKMNPGAAPPAADWRIQLTREHRANLIAKIYNEMVRVSADPMPGIKLWMNVSWYELTLYKESRTQEDYINKIFNRLKALRAQQTDMNAAMAAQALPNQGMLSRLDFSYYNQMNMNPRATTVGQPQGYPGQHPQFANHPGVMPPQQQQQMQQQQQQVMAQQQQAGKPMMPGAMGVNGAAGGGGGSTGNTPRSSMSNAPGIKQDAATASSMPVGVDNAAEYWQQHAALKSKYHDDVEKVHSAFKKYVDHMKGHEETEQKKKLRYLLSYVQLCANILSEDKTTHPPRKIDELDKVYKYIVKIVNPYLKKLRTETDKRTFTPNGSNGAPAGVPNPGAPGPAPPGGVNGAAPAPGTNSSSGPLSSSTSTAATNSVTSTSTAPATSATMTSAGMNNAPNGAGMDAAAMAMRQQQMAQQQKNAQMSQQQAAQQKHAQYQQHLQQQRAHQMQQQRMMQQRQQQQQMMQRQQQMMQQQNPQQQNPQQQNQQKPPSGGNNPQMNAQQAQMAAQQQQQLKQQQQSQQQNNQQQMAQRATTSQPGTSQAQQQQQTPQRPQQTPPQQTQQQQQKPQQTPQQPPKAPQQNPQQQQQGQNGSARNESPSMNSGLGLSIDDSLYGGMDSSLLQMPSNLGGSGGANSYMGFGNDLSPSNFSGGMDLMLDIDGSGLSGLSYDLPDGQGRGNGDDGDSSDLMGFVEAL